MADNTEQEYRERMLFNRYLEAEKKYKDLLIKLQDIFDSQAYSIKRLTTGNLAHESVGISCNAKEYSRYFNDIKQREDKLNPDNINIEDIIGTYYQDDIDD